MMPIPSVNHYVQTNVGGSPLGKAKMTKLGSLQLGNAGNSPQGCILLFWSTEDLYREAESQVGELDVLEEELELSMS